jgi:hypothetical protein
MDWIDLLHRIGNVLQQETEVPWRIAYQTLWIVQLAPLHALPAGVGQEQPQSRPITTPTCFDVVGGRGQGVQRLPGNRRYRELVAMNKVR